MERVTFIAANDARRASTKAALAKPRTPTELRVLLAVHSLTVDWSKLEDRISIEQIAEAAGLGDDQRNRVRTALRRLADDNALVYRPGKVGRGNVGVVGIPPGQNGVSTDPILANGKGVNPARKRGQSGIGNGVSTDPHPREDPSLPKKERRRARRPPSTTASWDAATGGLIQL